MSSGKDIKLKIVDWSQESSGAGVLSKVVIRDDGSVETKTLDLDFTWSVDDETTKLPAMLAMFPYAEELLARARSGKGSYTSTFKPADCNIKLALLGFEKSATVRQVVFRPTAKSATVTARVRTQHVKPRTEGGELMWSHGTVVAISTKVAQQSMAFSAPSTDIGDLVVAAVDGQDVYGQVTRERDGGGFVVSDFGIVHSHVAEDCIVTTHKLEFGGYGTREEFEQEFQVAATTAGKVPTWQAILAALANMHGEGTVHRKADGAWLVTQDVMVEALGLLGVEALPPEAAAQA